MLTTEHFLILALLFSLDVMLARALPFIIFKKSKEIPKWVNYLGKVLPSAMMGFLVIYCYKDYSISEPGMLIAALIAGIIVVLIHLWKKNTILSITIGTIVYMILIP